MSKIQKFLILLICSYFLNIFTLAYSSIDEEEKKWPKLFSGEVWIVILDETGRYELKSKINDEKMINANMSTNEIKWWMMESFGEGYGKAKYDHEIAKNLIKVLNQIAWKVQEKIDNCQVLQNMYGDKIKKRDDFPISFQYYKYGACGDTISRSVRMNNNMLHLILKDIGEQLKNGVENVQANVSKYSCEGNDILDIWGHETLHAITGAGEPSEADECLTHCLTKKCIAENPDDYVLKNFQTNQGGNLKCNEITDQQWEYLIDRTGDVDPRDEMKAGDCFCDEKWTEDAECDEYKPEPPIPEWGSVGSSSTDRKAIAYIPDLPDDHYSFSDFVAFSDNDMNLNSEGNFIGDTFNEMLCFNYYPDILIYNKYGTSLMENLLNRIMPGNYIDDYTHDYFSTNHKILVIPSAALIGDSQSEIVKQAIMNFLENGKSVVLLSQQFGNDIKRLIPTNDDEIGTIIGFREDSSCLKNSVYIAETGMHPILSSSTKGILDVGIDGYATVGTGSNAKVLLRRKANGEPALLYYKYGNGTIYLFFGFTDYENSRSMASVQEFKLVKNMLRHAMDPDAYVPMFDLEENPNPTISFNIQASNHSEIPAAKAKIYVYTIDNTPVYETEAPVSLNQGESAEIPITFTLPELETKDYGIGFTVYELEDASGNLIQLKTETPTGRFSIYKLITPANINGGLYQWITINDEIAYWGQEIECTIHVKNETDQVKQIVANNPFFAIGHGGIIHFNSFSITVEPGETVEHTAYLPTTEFSQWDNSKITFRIMYYDSEGNYKQFGAGKVVYVKKALTQSTVELNTPYALAPGGSLDYSLHSFSGASIAGETTIKLVLEKYNRENSTYSEIKTIFQGIHDYSTNGDFQYNHTYIPETVHPSGSYRLKLEVTAPNGVKELTRYQDFFYQRSGFKVAPGAVKPLRWLVPGESYTIPVYVENVSSNNDYHVTNGLCILRVLSPGSQEIYRKEITNIDITPGSQLNLTETFVFNPVETGDYTLEYAYKDETFSDNLRSRKAQVLYYWPSFSVTPDKPAYDYMDTANIEVKVNGLGSYTLQCQCPEAGVAETRSVRIPEPGITATEVFQVPLGLSSYYHVNVQVTDASNKSFEKTTGLYVKPVQLDCSGEFKSPIRAGFPLEFEVNLKGISGFSQPLTGELAVTSSQLNYQDIKTVTLQPIGDNRFVYAIPVDMEAPIGFYGVDAQFNLNGVNLVTRQHTIYLPDANLEFSLLGPGTFNVKVTIMISDVVPDWNESQEEKKAGTNLCVCGGMDNSKGDLWLFFRPKKSDQTREGGCCYCPEATVLHELIHAAAGISDAYDPQIEACVYLALKKSGNCTNNLPTPGCKCRDHHGNKPPPDCK